MRIAFPMRCALALCALLVGLSGCTLLPHSEPVTLYQLPSPEIRTIPSPQMDIALCISTPEATGLMSGNHIVVIQKNAVTTYPQARWTDQAPLLWRDYLLVAFQRDNRIMHLCTDAEPILADYVLYSTLRSFHYEHGMSQQQVIISLDLRLVSVKHQRIIASEQFTSREPVTDQQIDTLVRAFGLASDHLTQTITDWTFRELRDAIDPTTGKPDS